jgi:hypothetical protein
MLKMRVFRYAIILAAIASTGPLVSCSKSYRESAGDAEKVHPVARERAGTPSQEIDGGITANHDQSDPGHAGGGVSDSEAWLEAVEIERFERIQQASKRRTGDRVYVAFYGLEIDERLGDETNAGQSLGARLRSEFERDGVIVLVSDADLRMGDRIETANLAAGLSPNRSPVADVDVRSKATIEEGARPGSQEMIVVLEATITSNFLPAEYTVKERGSILDDVDLARRFAGKVKRVVKEAIGPTLPADRNL